MSNQKNTNASLRNMEIQIGKLAKQLAENPKSTFSANTEVNPREHGHSILRGESGPSGKNLRSSSRRGKEVAREDKNSKFVSNDTKKIVNLSEDDFEGFLFVIEKNGWQNIAQLKKFFSLDVVKQFFSNSITSSEARRNRYTWVNGTQVFYNKHVINEYLDNPWNPPSEEHDLCDYQMKINASYLGEEESHEEEYVRKCLCLEDLELNMFGPIFKFCMTQQTQIWASFILSNIYLSLHVSDIPLPKSKLISSIYDEDSIDIAAVISDTICDCINKGTPLIILPSFITDLCKFQNVSGPYKEMMALKSEINHAYVTKNCKEKTVSKAQTELRKKFGDLNSKQPSEYGRIMSSKVDAIMKEQQMQILQQKTCYRGIKGIYKSLHCIFGKKSNFKGGSYVEFVAKTKWLEGRSQDTSEEEEKEDDDE
uniref:Putative plant transposon protein domain-containing protein n=1 Tax=Lupinus angustifolius TaxID=3871 RepID=L0P0W4_LUPAN|nr:hypothetical protein [Lupinus angustifolius]